MLSPKVALVTGGGSGIGKAIAASLCKNGAKVAILSRNPIRIEKTAAELRQQNCSVLPLQADVRRKSDIQRAVAHLVSTWGPVHILVNNAGISGLSLITDEDDGKWLDIIDTNLNGL